MVSPLPLLVAAALVLAQALPGPWCRVAAACAARAASAAAATLWVPARGGYLEDWRMAARMAGRVQEGVAIQVVPLWGDDWGQLTQALAEGRGPHLVVVSPELAARLASRGMLQALPAPRGERPGLPREAYEPFRWRGELYALPGFADPAVLYVHQDLLEQAGILPAGYPRDWEELLRLARAVRSLAGGGRSPWGFPVNGWPPLELFVWQAGGSVVEPPDRLWEDSGPLEQAARFYRTFVVEQLSPSPPDSWRTGPQELFQEGQAALMIGLYSHRLEQPDSRRAPFRAALAPLPVGPSGRPVGWMWVEGLALPRPASPLARRALSALELALGVLGPLPPSARRPEADTVAREALAVSRTLPALAGYLEFSSAWWSTVVQPLLTQPEPLDIPALLAQARAVLLQALRQGTGRR
ncbi:MAG TPA: extracellular solute-binding protein [Limnochordales bacterium]